MTSYKMVPKAELERIIKKAGLLLLDYYGKQVSIHEKGPLQLVTQADLASEQLLKQELLSLLPGAAILSEEKASQEGNNEYCWVVDPLDGTNNFAHGIGYFCVSVALMHKNEIIQGAIYQPLLNELFYAERGGGSFLNGVSIKAASRVKSPMLSFAYLEAKQYKHLIDRVPFAYTFRHLGAAALDMAYVACGRIDAMISQGLYWWDLAAGVLLVQEAGGKVADFTGRNVHKDSTSCIATTPQIYPLLATILCDDV